ncbi:ABC transporter substrate-binding protein [Roseiarcus sp.]|uniref:ABC transporter substrate-binding protein n=1 Tax=Roseiarcus sp. TaxID=1969460 RepID=UPI003F993CA1
MVSRRAFLQSSAASLGGLAWGASPSRADTPPGVTETEIKIGQTMPYSGPLSAYGVIGKTDAAYFAMINESGGVNGRKIRLISVDDEYNPAKTVEQTRRLVEYEGVAFIFNSLGTWTNGAIRAYLNINEVPQLFVASGAEMFGDQERFPWTMGWQPSYQTEAAIFGKQILATKPDAKIGVLYQDDSFGRDYMVGLKEGLGAKHARMIVETATYETGATTIDSQIVALRRAGADTFMIVAVEELAEQAINKTFDIGWMPVRYLTGVSQSISSTMTPSGREKLKGTITAVYDKDPTDARWRDDAGFMLYTAFIKKYMSQNEQDDAKVVNGFGVAATMVHVLAQCGSDLSRKNIMYQASNIKSLELPMLLPGVKICTSSSNYHPIRKMQLASFNGSSWELFGELLGS